MAILRSDPYMWVTWLSKIMSGQTACQWQGWFQTHNQLKERHPQSFDLTGWKINHTRMLTEFVQKMTERGLEPRVEFPFTIAVGKATLGGLPSGCGTGRTHPAQGYCAVREWDEADG